MALPPCNIEAEQACLGACLLDSDAIDKVSEVISNPADFYKLAHQQIYATMLHLVNVNCNIDIITVSDYLRQQGHLNEVGGAAYLDNLSTTCQSSAHVAEYAHIVADTALARRLLQAGQGIIKLVYDGDDTVLDKVDKAEELLFAVSDQGKKCDLMPLESTLIDTFKELYEAHLNHGATALGLPTGWPELDNLIGGLKPGNLIVIGARPSMGKTAFALDLARHLALGGRDAAVAIFSLEMSRDEIQQRLVCATAQVNNRDLTSGRLTDMDWQRIANAIDNLTCAPIYIDDEPAQTVLGIKSKLRRLSKRVNLGAVIIDYLQLMHGSAKFASGPVNRVQEISEITRQLKGMAKELKVPVVALSQLSRALENRQDKRPIMADLRESGSIEQDADLIAFLYRDAYYNPATLAGNEVEIIVAKQRNGPVDTVRLEFINKYGCFCSQMEEYLDGI